MQNQKKRKIISTLLILSILTTVFIPLTSKAETLSDDINVYLSSDATEVKQGSTLTITMNLELKSGIKADTFGATIKYDPDVLSIDEEPEFTTSSQTKWSAPSTSNIDGEIQVESSRSDSNSGKSGIMFTFEFEVLKTVSSTSLEIEEPVNFAYMATDIWCKGSTLTISK